MENWTPSASTEAFPLATFWSRFAAFFFDSLIILIPGLLLNWIVPGLGGLVALALYKPFFESSLLQATPGKALMGLRVITLQGERLTFKQAFIRYLSTLLSSALLMMGYIMAAFTLRHQALHDMIADTLVIRHAPPAVNYLETWMDEIQSVFGFINSGNSKEPAPSQPLAQKLQDLQDLLAKGLITEEDYKLKKDELLKNF